MHAAAFVTSVASRAGGELASSAAEARAGAVMLWQPASSGRLGCRRAAAQAPSRLRSAVWTGGTLQQQF